MSTSPTFDELLDAVEQFSPDEQSEFASIIQRRLAELGRERIVASVKEAREEFKAGKAVPVSVDELMREIEE